MAQGLKIVTIPNPVLRQVSQKVEITPQVKKLIKRMKATLAPGREITGLGLAAPQVGYNWQIFLTIFEDNKKALPLRVFINPQIINKSQTMVSGVPNMEFKYEGCLSIPDIYGLVDRHQWIVIKYSTFDDQGQVIEKEEKFEGLLATVIQHEYDHLQGILFVDRVISAGRQLYQLVVDKTGQEKLKVLDQKLPLLEIKNKQHQIQS